MQALYDLGTEAAKKDDLDTIVPLQAPESGNALHL